MTYQSLYQRYRSQSFSELVGQEHIAQSLQHAVSRNQIGHAYLFSGPRGTGKTSSARIFAKMLNCTSNTTEKICNEPSCICSKITHSESVDIIEIDAASHTGVDHMRRLNEQVQLVPIECRFKVIIIDEVHMLSIGSFNALLKTLEEPPKNVVFILATTEFYKLPATIRSRCQHFQFRLLNNDQIITQLKYICKQEHIDYENAILPFIAKQAKGSMRDALSILDQARVFSDDNITLSGLCDLLGSADRNQVIVLTKHLLEKNATAFLKQSYAFESSGIHVNQLCQEIIDILQEILKIQSQSTQKEISEVEIQKLADSASFSDCILLFETMSKTLIDCRWHPFPMSLIQLKGLSYIQPETKVRQTTIQQQDTTSNKHSDKSNLDLKPIQKTTNPSSLKPVKESLPAQAETTSQTQDSYSKIETPTSPINQNPPQSPDSTWRIFLEHIKKSHKALFALLQQSQITNIQKDVWHIQLNSTYPFFLDKANNPQTQTFIEYQAKKCSLTLAKKLTFHLKDASSSSNTLFTSDQATKPNEPDSTHQIQNTSNQVTLNDLIKRFEGTLLN